MRKGVIMMPAKGEDPIHAGLNSNMSKLDRSKMENSPGLNNKIAKLQFLDYICGNPDRHQGNIFYQFSEEGKLIGVQGIDNDASFGANKDFYKMRIDNVYGKDQVIKVGNSVRFEDLRLISESMADTVMNLNPDTYAFRLYGYGLEEKEIEACSHRLIITTSTKNSKPEDNLIITTDTEKKGVWDPEDEGLTPEQLARKYSTLPESIKTIPKSDIYTRLNEALDKVYDYLSDSAAQKVMDEYQTIQFCLSDPAYRTVGAICKGQGRMRRTEKSSSTCRAYDKSRV